MADNATFELETRINETLNKRSIIHAAYPEIKKEVDGIISNPTMPGEAKRMRVFGTVFEKLAVYERIAQNPETETQRELRQIFEILIHDSYVALGELEPVSTPDGISVIFDKNGRLVIDEVLEMKSSAKACHEGIRRNQPQKTLNTIERLIDLVNSLAEGTSIKDLPPAKELKSSNAQRRFALLTIIQQKIIALNLKENITLSPDLKYTTIIPDGEKTEKASANLKLKDGSTVTTNIVNSMYSKRDIHCFIDDYAETS